MFGEPGELDTLDVTISRLESIIVERIPKSLNELEEKIKNLNTRLMDQHSLFSMASEEVNQLRKRIAQLQEEKDQCDIKMKTQMSTTENIENKLSNAGEETDALKAYTDKLKEDHAAQVKKFKTQIEKAEADLALAVEKRNKCEQEIGEANLALVAMNVRLKNLENASEFIDTRVKQVTPQENEPFKSVLGQPMTLEKDGNVQVVGVPVVGSLK